MMSQVALHVGDAFSQSHTTGVERLLPSLGRCGDGARGGAGAVGAARRQAEGEQPRQEDTARTKDMRCPYE